MSRKRKIGMNSGDEYTDEEYNNIFQWLIRGISFRDIAIVLKREVNEIKKAWRRICRNASEYDDERIYELWPIDKRPGMLNGLLKEFIQIQYSKTKQSKKGCPPTANELSKITNVPKERIQQYIDENNSWVRKKKQTLF